jgi:hypothetical protein
VLDSAILLIGEHREAPPLYVKRVGGST